MKSDSSSPNSTLVLLVSWFGLGIICLLVAMQASARFPVTDLERQIPIAPAQWGSADYLQRALVNPFVRWDALFHFPRIVTDGYTTGASTLAFYPLYPMLARLLYLAGLHPYVGLLLVAWGAGLALVLMFHRLAALDLPPAEALWAALLLLVFPISMVLYIPYMESLFLFFVAACLYWARRRWWIAAGVAGMLATLTKQPGILLVIPLAIELGNDARQNHVPASLALRNWLAVSLIPLAFVGWTGFRILFLERSFTWSGNIDTMILNVLVSSHASDMVLSRPFTWPGAIIGEALRAMSTTPLVRLNVAINLGGFLVVTALFITTWRYLRPAYRAYALAILAFGLLDYSWSINSMPLPSMFRHAYLAMPVFIGVPQLIRGTVARLAYACICLVAFMILLYAYVMRAWIV